MKNLILFLLWVAFITLIIIDLKNEEFVNDSQFSITKWPVILIAAMAAPVGFLLINIYCYIDEKSKWRMREISFTIYLLIGIIIALLFVLVFYLTPLKFAPYLVILAWIATLASAKLGRFGLIGRVLTTPGIVRRYKYVGEEETHWELRYEIKSILCSISPFHTPSW